MTTSLARGAPSLDNADELLSVNLYCGSGVGLHPSHYHPAAAIFIGLLLLMWA
jgi:hypothetical protein